MIYSSEQYDADLNSLGRFANDAVYWSRCVFDKKSRKQFIAIIELMADPHWLKNPTDTDLQHASELRKVWMNGLMARAMEHWFDRRSGPIILRPKYLDDGAYRLYMLYGRRHFMQWLVNPAFVPDYIKNDLKESACYRIKAVIKKRGDWNGVLPQYRWLDNLYRAIELGLSEGLIFRDRKIYNLNPGVEYSRWSRKSLSK